MRKVLLVAAATMLSSIFAGAQSTLQLPYEKSVGKNGNTWESWPKDWVSTQKEYNFVPNVTIKKIDNEIFSVEFYFGGSSSGILKDNVVYDPTETAKIRKSNSKNTLHAYRFTGSKDYLWTDGVTLAELYSNPKKWTSTKNARIYTWQHSLGSATIYAAQGPAQPAKKYPVSFTSTSKLIKGTWSDWSQWRSIKNAYFELQVVEERRVFNFKYYENGKLTKNYQIVYDGNHTKARRDENQNVSCYKIKGSKDDWIYLMNTSMTNILANPDKWSKENNAVIAILDDEKTGHFIRIK